MFLIVITGISSFVLGVGVTLTIACVIKHIRENDKSKAFTPIDIPPPLPMQYREYQDIFFRMSPENKTKLRAYMYQRMAEQAQVDKEGSNAAQ